MHSHSMHLKPCFFEYGHFGYSYAYTLFFVYFLLNKFLKKKKNDSAIAWSELLFFFFLRKTFCSLTSVHCIYLCKSKFLLLHGCVWLFFGFSVKAVCTAYLPHWDCIQNVFFFQHILDAWIATKWNAQEIVWCYYQGLCR